LSDHRIIFAIDPGNIHSAFVIYRTDPQEIIRWGKVDNYELLREIGDLDISCSFAIEKIASYGMSVGAEIFSTCFWTGRFQQRIVDKCGVDPIMIERGKIKMHLCHTMRAKDGNIRQALIDKLGPQGTKKHPGPTYGLSKDGWAALGVAVTVAEATT